MMTLWYEPRAAAQAAKAMVCREGPRRFRAEISEITSDGAYRRLADFGVFETMEAARAALAKASEATTHDD